MTNDPQDQIAQIADLERQISHLKKRLEQEQMRQRRDDELLKFERLLSELSSRFINMPLTDMQTEVENGLKAIADFLDVDQIAIIEFSKDQSKLVTNYSYSRDNIEFPVPLLPGDSYPHWTEQVLNGNLVIWPTFEDIPEFAEAERQYALDIGVKAHLTIPLILVCMLIQIGAITPPIGLNIFTVKAVAKKVPMGRIFKGAMPFLIANILVTGILFLFPWLSLILPRLMMG